MERDRIPLLCAFMGVFFLSNRMRPLAMLSALVGIAWLLLADDLSLRCSRGILSLVSPDREKRERRPRIRARFLPPSDEQPLDEAPPKVLRFEPPELPVRETWDPSVGEFMDDHATVGPSGRSRRAMVVSSPDLHELGRSRLPAAAAANYRNRLHRVSDASTGTFFRGSNGSNSSFAHLR